MYKILHGLDNLDKRLFFDRNRNRTAPHEMCMTWGNDLKLYKSRFRLDVARYSFGKRVIDLWNALPNEIIWGKTLNTFKINLDKHIVQHRGFT